MDKKRVVVAGFGASGSVYALFVKKFLGKQADVIAIEYSNYPPYSRCGLPYLVSGIIAEPEQLYHQPRSYYEENGIKVLYNTRITEIDPDNNIAVAETSRGLEEIEFDILGYALGHSKIVPPIPGVDDPRVVTFYDMDDAIKVRKLAGKSKKAVVIGAGPTGFEVACELARLRLSVDVVEIHPWPLYAITDKDIARRIIREEARIGLRFHTSTKATEIRSKESGLEVSLDNGEVLEADFVVLATGTKPNIGVAKKAGFPIGSSGGIVVDEHLRVKGYEHIYGIGTVIEHTDAVTGRKTITALASFGIKTAMIAAYNTSGYESTLGDSVRTSIVKGFDIVIGSTGITSTEAVSAGFNPVTQTIISSTRAHYMPENNTLIVKLIADEDTGRILGLQVIGDTYSVKSRIDTVAAMIRMKATISDLAGIDWGYTPYVSEAWEPLVIAANKLLEKQHIASKR